MVSVLSDITNERSIENSEDIINIVRSKYQQYDALKVESYEKSAEINKLRNVNRQKIEEINQTQTKITLVNDRLSLKEQNCKELMMLKESITIEKETLAIRYQELQQQHKVLHEEHKRLSNHCDGLNHDGIYANCEAILRNHSRELEAVNRTLQEENANLSKSLTKMKLENSELFIQKDSVESLLQQQTREHDAVFTNFQNQIEQLRSEEARSSHSIAELKDQILTLNAQNQELKQEKESCANRLQEKEHALREAKNQARASERERQRLKVVLFLLPQAKQTQKVCLFSIFLKIIKISKIFLKIYYYFIVYEITKFCCLSSSFYLKMLVNVLYFSFVENFSSVILKGRQCF